MLDHFNKVMFKAKNLTARVRCSRLISLYSGYLWLLCTIVVLEEIRRNNQFCELMIWRNSGEMCTVDNMAKYCSTRIGINVLFTGNS